MTSIIDYFNSVPNSVGSSTFQLDDLTSNKLKNDSNLSNYQTLIGSVENNFQNLFETGADNKYPALLLHAADIFWGDAVMTNQKAIDRLKEIDLYHNSRIRTSRDIIAILEYLLANMNSTPGLLPRLTINPSSVELNELKTSQEIVVSLTSGSIDGNSVKWEITNTSGSGTMQLSGTTGTSVTVTRQTPVTQPEAAKGTITYNAVNGSTTNKGQTTINASFVKGQTQTNNLEYSCTVKATYNDSSITSDVSYKGSKSTSPLAAGDWSWDLTGADPRLKFSGENTSSLTIVNETDEEITVTVICKNTNAENRSITATVKKVTPDKQYYYLASIIGATTSGDFVGSTDVFDTTVYSNAIEINKPEKITVKEDNLKANLKNINGVQTSTSDNANLWAADSLINKLGAKIWYPFIIAPKTWYTAHSSKILINKTVNVQATMAAPMEFEYDGTTYVLARYEGSMTSGSDVKIIVD